MKNVRLGRRGFAVGASVLLLGAGASAFAVAAEEPAPPPVPVLEGAQAAPSPEERLRGALRNIESDGLGTLERSKTVTTASGRVSVASGRTADGTPQICFQDASRSGGCTNVPAGGLNRPVGSVSGTTDGRYTVTAVVPAGVTDLVVLGADGKKASMSVVEGVGSATVSAVGLDRLQWKTATGVVDSRPIGAAAESEPAASCPPGITAAERKTVTCR